MSLGLPSQLDAEVVAATQLESQLHVAPTQLDARTQARQFVGGRVQEQSQEDSGSGCKLLCSHGRARAFGCSFRELQSRRQVYGTLGGYCEARWAP